MLCAPVRVRVTLSLCSRCPREITPIMVLAIGGTVVEKWWKSGGTCMTTLTDTHNITTSSHEKQCTRNARVSWVPGLCFYSANQRNAHVSHSPRIFTTQPMIARSCNEIVSGWLNAREIRSVITIVNWNMRVVRKKIIEKLDHWVYKNNNAATKQRHTNADKDTASSCLVLFFPSRWPADWHQYICFHASRRDLARKLVQMRDSCDNTRGNRRQLNTRGGVVRAVARQSSHLMRSCMRCDQGSWRKFCRTCTHEIYAYTSASCHWMHSYSSIIYAANALHAVTPPLLVART